MEDKKITVRQEWIDSALDLLDKEELKEYTKVLYAQARLIEGLPIENPTEISNLICNLIAK